jgi:acetyl-CoA carboxylase carboxyl transferase subunit beta
MAPGGWFSRSPRNTTDLPDGLWTKCPKCERIVFTRDLERSLKVCPHCDHHFRLTAWERVEMLVEPGSFKEWDSELRSSDPLEFPEYKAKLAQDREKTGLSDAAVTGEGRIGETSVALGITDFRFRAGAMNSVVGERLTRAIDRAV